MTLKHYIKKRPRSGYWQLRVPVPKDVQAAYARKEVTRSLRETDRAKAEDEAQIILGDLKRQWRALRQSSGAAGIEATPTPRCVTQQELEVLAVQRGYEPVLAELERRRRGLSDEDEARYETHLENRRAEMRRLVRSFNDGAHDRWRGVADRIIANEGLLIASDSDAYARFVAAIAEATIAAWGDADRRNSGELSSESHSPLVQRVRERAASTAAPGETLMELFERYATQRMAEKRKRLDTINQDRKVIEQFAKFIGEKRSVDSITKDEVRDWIDTVALLPPNFGKRKEYRGLAMKQAAEKARKAGEKGVSLTTINKYLSTVSPLFKWLHKRNYYSGANPCDGLFNDIPKGSNPYPPFTSDQLSKIIESPLFTGFQAPGREHLPGNMQANDWRYWIPLICLFTGARIGEIAQLRVDDIAREHDVWFIHIRHDEGTGQTTKSKHSRFAAVHSILERLGFLDFHERQVERAARDGNFQLFPELKPNARGHMSGKPSRFWRDYLDSIQVKNGRDGIGAHSFRHTLADQLRKANYLDDQIEVALGHNQKTVTSGYGQLKQGTVTFLRDMIESVKFDGVVFSGLVRKSRN